MVTTKISLSESLKYLKEALLEKFPGYEIYIDDVLEKKINDKSQELGFFYVITEPKKLQERISYPDLFDLEQKNDTYFYCNLQVAISKVTQIMSAKDFLLDTNCSLHIFLNKVVVDGLLRSFTIYHSYEKTIEVGLSEVSSTLSFSKHDYYVSLWK